MEAGEVTVMFVSSVGAPWTTATQDPICPVNIYDPLLYTKACSRHQKSQFHGEEISQEALSQEEAQSMLSRAAKE